MKKNNEKLHIFFQKTHVSNSVLLVKTIIAEAMTMKGMLDLDILEKANFTVYFVQMLRFETKSILQIADYACKMSHVLNNSLPKTIPREDPG